MATPTDSEFAWARAKQNAASVATAKSRRLYRAGYISNTVKQCPKHNVDYVLRHSSRKAPALLMYDCPVEGCFNTLQVPTKG